MEKLKKDFGIKALLATLSVGGFLVILLVLVIANKVGGDTALQSASSLALAASAFYFGARANSGTASGGGS